MAVKLFPAWWKGVTSVPYCFFFLYGTYHQSFLFTNILFGGRQCQRTRETGGRRRGWTRAGGGRDGVGGPAAHWRLRRRSTHGLGAGECTPPPGTGCTVQGVQYKVYNNKIIISSVINLKSSLYPSSSVGWLLVGLFSKRARVTLPCPNWNTCLVGCVCCSNCFGLIYHRYQFAFKKISSVTVT